MEIVLIVFAFIALFLLIVWLPFFKRSRTDLNVNTEQSIRDETNVVLYKEHKAEIEKDFVDGAIDDENYQYLLAELDNSLLQDISAEEKKSNTVVKSNKISVIWPIFLSIFIVGFTISVYLQQGTLNDLMKSPVADANQKSSDMQQQNQQEQMLTFIKNMQQHLDKNPDDSEAWYNLGQTFVAAGEFKFAIAAFEQVIRIEGEHADLLGAIAQASYYLNNQKIDENIQGLIDKALAIDINDPSTNILLGMHNFIGNNYQKAIDYWQRVIDTKRQNVNITALTEAVNEARKRLGELSSTDKTKPINIGPQLNLNISLSEDVASQLSKGEDKVVFVYAIPTDGRRMPLAAVKLMASDLPKVVTLSDSNAMSPQNNLSSVSEVNIFAVVSQLGGAGIKPGDYKAEINDIPIDNTATINLVVDSLVIDE